MQRRGPTSARLTIAAHPELRDRASALRPLAGARVGAPSVIDWLLTGY